MFGPLPPLRRKEFSGIEYVVLSKAAGDRAPRLPQFHDALATTSYLQNEFDRLIATDNVIRELVKTLSKKSYSAAVVGGWVRDHLINFKTNRGIPFRDIDIVADLPEGVGVPSLLSVTTTPNLFGGCSLSTETTHLDIWSARDTYLVRLLGLPVDLDVLPATTVFRINSVIFKPQQLTGAASIVDRGSLDACSKRIIDFQARHIPLPHVQVGRALTYATKLQFSISDEVASFIRKVCLDEKSLDLSRLALQRCCPTSYLREAQELLEKLLT
jgi:hypothetical protein